LQGLLTGLPFYLWPVPEAPFILLNLLSTASLCLLAHYINKRIPGIPAWFVWIWILTCPWAMNFSTHIVNPSYVLPAAIVFFIAFMESVPALRAGYLRHRITFFLMGISLLWIFQLHLSWVLLLPFIIFSLFVTLRKGWKEAGISALLFLAGSLLGGVTLIPTLIKYGLAAGSGGTASNIILNWKNLGDIFTVLTRYLSFASFEVPRFIGGHTSGRLEFLQRYIWASPFIVFVFIMGLVQPVWMVIAAFLRNGLQGFKATRLLAALAFLLTWISFLFSVKDPSSHTFYVMFPVIMIYSFYCWKPLLERRWVRALAAAMLFSGLVFHSVLMYDKFHKESMYTNRSIPLKALQEKNYHIFGERNSFDRNE
jgi:hypothetical protein